MSGGTFGYQYPPNCSDAERERIDAAAARRGGTWLPDYGAPMRTCKVCRQPFRTFEDPMHEAGVTCPACKETAT